jgi:hypothetical protein
MILAAFTFAFTAGLPQPIGLDHSLATSTTLVL